MGVFRLTIYGIIAGVFLYAIYYDIVYLPRIGHSWWIYKLVMLTMINLVLQAIYYVICFACAFMDALREKTDYGPHKKHPTTPSYWRDSKLHRISDFMYFTIIIPIGATTCLIFWALYAVESTLVIPKWAEGLIPPFMNHITHTAPLPFLLVDTLLTCHRAPPRQIGSVVVLALVPCYFIIVVGVRYFHGYWLYPFLEYLSVAGLILMFLISFVFLWLLYIIGDTMNIMLWGGATHSLPSDKGK
ncbi:Androgen-induced protein [Dirofilaria immitis]